MAAVSSSSPVEAFPAHELEFAFKGTNTAPVAVIVGGEHAVDPQPTSSYVVHVKKPADRSTYVTAVTPLLDWARSLELRG